MKVACQLLLNFQQSRSIMSQTFSFDFEGSDNEESDNETVQVGPAHDALQNKSVTVAEPKLQPKLHKLQDLVCNAVLSPSTSPNVLLSSLPSPQCSQCCSTILEATRRQLLVSSICNTNGIILHDNNTFGWFSMACSLCPTNLSPIAAHVI